MSWNALQKSEDLNNFFAGIYERSQSQRMRPTVKDTTDPHDCIRALLGADEFPSGVLDVGYVYLFKKS